MFPISNCESELGAKVNNGEFSIRPGDVNDANRQLGELADRLANLMDTEALNLTVEPSARDEVSQRVATTLNDVHTSFGKASDQGQRRLRELVAALRTHADQLVAADEDVAV
jgi:hypothetical protein